MNACVLIRTSHGKFDEVVRSLQNLKGVKRIFSTLGRFDAVADVEVANLEELDALVLRMENFAGIVFTETLPELRQ